ncbi:MAG: hypothetical protein ACMUEM_05990 [Flavobacteriales bacterium AspAUS03]
MAPSHNSITPVDEIIPAGLITVAFGNTCESISIFFDSDLWTELHVIFETCHYYDINQLDKIVTDNGLRVFGI